MTKLEWGQTTCAVCKATSSHLGLTSAFIVGHDDLDTRPGGTGRPLTGFSIERCYSCGYTARRIADDPPDGVRAILDSPGYRAVLEDDELSAAARQFLARSLIDEQVGDHAAAGWGALRGAWMCEDDGKDEAARRCRTRALALFRRAESENVPFAPGGTAACVVADILRRIGRFEEAAAECERALESETDGPTRSILAFQARLARARDSDRHDLGEVPQDSS